MLPLWLQYYAERCDGYFRNTHLPLPTLLLLLREIGQFQSGRDFLLVEPPRSTVFYPGDGMYLFYPNGHRQLASFELCGYTHLHSIGLRYRDPLNVKSGVDTQIHTGWMGMSKLIESAVNSSPFFSKLQTIETKCSTMRWDEITYGEAEITQEVTYDIWVRARRSWSIGWEAENEPPLDEDGNIVTIRRVGSGSFFLRNFTQGQQILLARVKVERVSARDGELQAELVRNIELYPEYDDVEQVYGHAVRSTFLGYPVYHLRENGRSVATTLGTIARLDHMRIEGSILSLPPHSEIRMSYRR